MSSDPFVELRRRHAPWGVSSETAEAIRRGDAVPVGLPDQSDEDGEIDHASLALDE